MSNLTNISNLNSLLLANIGSSHLIDSLKLYLVVPLAIVGTILNSISYFILSLKTTKIKNIFKLMKIYNLTSLIVTFGVIFSFLYTPNVLTKLSISLLGRLYTCNIVNSIFILFFFYGNCLDILMNLERALNYSNGNQKIKQISPYLFGLFSNRNQVFCFVLILKKSYYF